MAEDKGKKEAPKSGGSKQAAPQGGGAGAGRMVQVPAGVLTFLKQFLQSNPDIAREVSTRMNAILNRQKIGAGNQLAAPGNSPDVKNMYRSAVGGVQSSNLMTKAAPKANGAQ